MPKQQNLELVSFHEFYAKLAATTSFLTKLQQEKDMLEIERVKIEENNRLLEFYKRKMDKTIAREKNDMQKLRDEIQLIEEEIDFVQVTRL